MAVATENLECWCGQHGTALFVNVEWLTCCISKVVQCFLADEPEGAEPSCQGFRCKNFPQGKQQKDDQTFSL